MAVKDHWYAVNSVVIFWRLLGAYLADQILSIIDRKVRVNI